MKSLKQLAVLLSSLLVFAIAVVAGQVSAPYDGPLGEVALARITGRSDTRAINTSACASAVVEEGQVLGKNCSGQPKDTPCVLCGNDRTTIIPNTSGGPGSQAAGGLAACKNYPKYLGRCVNGVCDNLALVGKCADVTPPNYELQP
jgi:hypothetical protein